ncbi:Uncharacterized protein QTN25_001883 [Entamoeba marina]
MTASTQQKDILDDVLMFSFSDYIASDLSVSDSALDSTTTIEPQNDTVDQPLSLSSNMNIIRTDFSNIVFCDYESCNDSDDSLASHFQKSSKHSFTGSSLGRLQEEWKNGQ